MFKYNVSCTVVHVKPLTSLKYVNRERALRIHHRAKHLGSYQPDYKLLSSLSSIQMIFFAIFVPCRIEETLEKLVEATNALSSDNMYTNIKDAMDSLIHTSVLEECACLPPDSEDVNKLLKIIVRNCA